MTRWLRAGLTLVLALGFTAGSAVAVECPLTDQERLGRRLLFDSRLSINQNQSCVACHAQKVGWTGPISAINATGGVYEGSVPGRFGNRKPPTAAYAGDSPVLHFDEAEGVWIGGMFWDGRATGWTLGDPLAEQAAGPFLNRLEQALPDPASVVQLVCSGPYADLFGEVWGAGACSPGNELPAYESIARSIAAYERSGEVSAFTSKYDGFLAGKRKLSAREKWGLELFEGKAKCSLCHPSRRGPEGEPPLFTDFTYDNLGLPANPMNPFSHQPAAFNPDGTAFVDLGLGGFLATTGLFPADLSAAENGKFKVPTLRNVDRRPEGFFLGRFVKAYGHNGVFKSLEDIVHFYNTRDVPGAGWPAPEYAGTVNRDELGDLGLTEEEEQALVEFLRTLDDVRPGSR